MLRSDLKADSLGTSQVIQWFKTLTSNVGVAGSIPDWGDKILHALRPKIQHIKQAIL